MHSVLTRSAGLLKPLVIGVPDRTYVAVTGTEHAVCISISVYIVIRVSVSVVRVHLGALARGRRA